MASPPEHRWLPIFWALDHYKASAARDVEERGDWTMEPVDEAAVPAGPQGAARRSPPRWTPGTKAAADAPSPAWPAPPAPTPCTSSSSATACATSARSATRRSTSPTACARSNCIGWQHAEPVLRSLAYALLMHEGDNPRDRDADADRPYRRNAELRSNSARIEQYGAQGLPDCSPMIAMTPRRLATLSTVALWIGRRGRPRRAAE